jgi:hypothetical protein
MYFLNCSSKEILQRIEVYTSQPAFDSVEIDIEAGIK